MKIDGEWYFSKRHIYNEAIPEWASRYLNPVTNPSPPPRQRAPAAPAGSAQGSGAQGEGGN